MATSLKDCWNGGESHGLESEEYIKKGNNQLNWKIPKVPKAKIYKAKPFTLFSDPTIKTKEVEISCGNGVQGFNLISTNPIMHILQNKRFYTMFNVGLIQIGVKTLTTNIPSNASVSLCVFDGRNEKPEDWIKLGVVESNLSDGPLYFNVFPNITMSSFDPKLFDALTLTVVVEGFEKLPAGTKPVSLMWRICYKLQESYLPADALLESPQGTTVFFQTGFEKSNVAVKKVSKWDDVELFKVGA